MFPRRGCARNLTGRIVRGMNNETSERAKRSKNIVLPLGQNTSEMTTKLFKPTSHPQIDQNYEKIRLEPQKKNFKRMIEEML